MGIDELETERYISEASEFDLDTPLIFRTISRVIERAGQSRMKAGVGYSDAVEPTAAAADAVSAALRSGEIDRPDLVLIFGTSAHDPQRVAESVRERVGPEARIFGGHGAGVITNDRLGYAGHHLAILTLEAPCLEIEAFCERDLVGREAAVGRALAEKLASSGFSSADPAVLFFDLIANPPPEPRMSMATPLLKSFSSTLGSMPNVVGMACMGDFQMGPGVQWFDGEAVSRSAFVLGFKRGLQMDTAIMHGMKPASAYLKVTKTDGPIVLELNDRPAVALIDELLGPQTPVKPKDYPFFLTLGVNRGDKYAPFQEGNYQSRIVVGVDDERGGLAMFEPDLVPGTEVQLMRRGVDFEYMRAAIESLKARLSGRRPVFALYIDCMGRTTKMAGWEGEEASVVQEFIGPEVPLVGCYAGGEIAPIGDALCSLNYTGVLNIFSEDL